MPGRTTLPDALSWFPKEKLTSLRLVPESVLGMRAAEARLRGAVRVRQGVPGAGGVARKRPAGVLQKVRARFTGTENAQVGDEAFQVNDKYLGRLCFFRKGAYVGGYANVAEGQDPRGAGEGAGGKAAVGGAALRPWRWLLRSR